MKAIKKLYIPVLAIALVFGLAGFKNSGKEVAIEDFNKIYKAYLDNSRISMDITYQYFSSYTSNTPSQTSYGTIKRNGKCFYNKILNTESLLNEDYYINIDHTNKIILLNNPVNTLPNNGLPIKLDGYFNLYSSIKKDETDKENIKYIFGMASGNIEEVNISFSRKTFLVKKIVVFYRHGLLYTNEKEKPRIEITYRNVKTDPFFPAGFFSEKRYLSFDGNIRSPGAAFKGYRFYDYKN